MTPIVGNTLVGVIHASVDVRPATEDDLGAINDVYNHYVAETHVTFDDQPMSMETRREWFSHYGGTGRYRLLSPPMGTRSSAMPRAAGSDRSPAT
jgi:hypothetical protein